MKSAKQTFPGWYAREWAFVIMVSSVIALTHWRTARLAAPEIFRPSHPVASDPRVNWFFILRMPAITAQYESGIDTMKIRYGLWLDTIAKAGFQPMKLSDIYDHLSRGVGLPPKAVVLMFDPGLRRTYRLVDPILKQHRWPAVWISDEVAMKHGHREYITYHTAQEMVRSGWWDVGFAQRNGSIQLESRDHGMISLGDASHPVWSPLGGGVALNRGKSFILLKRLHVNSDWTEEDLINRLKVEVPVERQVFLIKAVVQNLTWGVTSDDASDPNTTLSFQVPAHKRGLVLNWFGTQGIPDGDIHAEGYSLIGDFTMRLRWDEERGNGISILLSREEVFVQELQGFHIKTQMHIPRQGSAANGRFSIDARVEGALLNLRLDARRPITIPVHDVIERSRGLFQLFLVDRFRGTARVQGLRMTFTPLGRVDDINQDH